MIDVGKRAGVSAQTVSRYFNGGYVSADAGARIAEAVTALGYRRNRIPIQMKSDHTDTIGLLSLGPFNFGSTTLLASLGQAARREGQSLVIEQFVPDPEDETFGAEQARKSLDHFLSMRVDGIIISSPYFGLTKLIDYVGDEVPVFPVSDARLPGATEVRSDSYLAAREAVRHLIDLGHRRILHLGGPDGRVETVTRRTAYLDELAAHEIDPLPVPTGNEWDSASGAECAWQVSPGSFTAVFAANDELALGFNSVMTKRGLSVPGDYSIVGFDDMPEARHFSPPLTTMRVDFHLIGERAMDAILSRIRGLEPRQEHLLADTELIVRESTARLKV